METTRRFPACWRPPGCITIWSGLFTVGNLLYGRMDLFYAMLAVFARTEPAKGGRRLLALGDMRELGEGADGYHAGLADAVAQSGATQVFLCGPHMKALWQRLAATQKGVHRPDSAALAGEVAAALRAGDVIAIKGSLGSKMKNVVDAVLAASGGEVGR